MIIRYVVLTIAGHAVILCLAALAHVSLRAQALDLGDVGAYFRGMSAQLIAVNRALGYFVL